VTGESYRVRPQVFGHDGAGSTVMTGRAPKIVANPIPRRRMNPRGAAFAALPPIGRNIRLTPSGIIGTMEPIGSNGEVKTCF
jgi:hypothetical protein